MQNRSYALSHTNLNSRGVVFYLNFTISPRSRCNIDQGLFVNDMLMGSINLEMWIDHRYQWGIDSIDRFKVNKIKLSLMANMSYCRFQNTRLDLQDCIDGLIDDGIDSLSQEELRAAKRVYILCKDFIDDWEEMVEFGPDPDRYKSEESEREY